MKTVYVVLHLLTLTATVALASPSVSLADDASNIDRVALRGVMIGIADEAKSIRDNGREYGSTSESFRNDLRDARDDNRGIGTDLDNIEAKLDAWKQIGNAVGTVFPWAAGAIGVLGLVYGGKKHNDLSKEKKGKGKGAAADPK